MFLTTHGNYEAYLEKLLEQATVVALQINELTDLVEILNTTVEQTRKTIECDRVLIYQFLPSKSAIPALVWDMSGVY